MNGKRSERAEATRVARRFAENLVSQRRRVDLSQVEIAERAGLHRTQISLLERGLRVPQLDTIVQVAAGFMPRRVTSSLGWHGRSIAIVSTTRRGRQGTLRSRSATDG